MMDSQEKAPIEEQNAEQNVVETAAEVSEETTAEVSEETTPEHKQYQSKKEVLERVREIAHSDEVPQKDEIDMLKLSARPNSRNTARMAATQSSIR